MTDSADVLAVVPWYEDADATLYHGDCLDVLKTLPDASVDAVVTDPPYGIEFMGKGWDKFREDLGIERSARWSGERSGAAGSSLRQSPKDATDVTSALENLPSYGGQRPTTSRCETCGKRDAFRNPHACGEDARWVREVVNPNTAPPSMLAFSEWVRQWAVECYRVLKPGGHLLAFGGSRTWHRLACGVEDAGFEMRDSIAWLYAQGFPKSLDVSAAIDRKLGATREKVRVDASEVRNPKATGGGRDGMEGGTRPWIEEALERGYHEKDGPDPVTDEARKWAGWGTALKPSFEPVVVARKPLAGTVAETVLAYGTGALNVGECRVGTEQRFNPSTSTVGTSTPYSPKGAETEGREAIGRWPTNVLLDEPSATELNRQGGTPALAAMFPVFRYEPKAPTHERPRDGSVAHPTVKPLDLMRWLVRLVTPSGGVVLEPFAGSGTTLEAAIAEGRRAIGIELTEEYLPLIRARLTRPIQTALDFGVDS